MDRKQRALQTYQKINDHEFLQDDQELNKIMKNYIYGDVYHHGSLSLATRELILIVVNTTNHTLSSLQQHVLSALKCQMAPEVIKEAIYQCTPYIGLGKVEDALAVVNKVFTKEKITCSMQENTTTDEENRFAKGFDVQSQAFGRDNIQANHDHAPQELKHIQDYLSAHCFGDFYTRKGLDLAQRELLTFVILATLGGCENQLRAHTGANVNVGNDREMLIDTITQCQPYIGFPRTLNALNIINEITQ